MQLCVHDGTIGGILSFCFYLLFTISLPQAFSFFLYILPGARFRALSAGVHCTLRVSGLISCETAHSTFIYGTYHANYIHEFSPGGGGSGPTDKKDDIIF